jgi:ABC-type branched-subunit amino acid transport system substrate-binding protein
MITRRRTRLSIAAGATAAVLLAAGCGSSGSGGGGASAGTKTVTVGVLTDVTGPAASGNKTFVDGVKAGVRYASRKGYSVKYVLGDTATNPATALSAAQKLVTQDHVVAVLASSALLFTASNYLTAHHVPVIGIASDGPEWATSTNMFGVTGALHQTKVATSLGNQLKLLGVTNLASIGYSVSPVSSEGAKSGAASAEAAGIKVGYLNAQFPFGSTDVGPVVLAMKAAGIDGLYTAVDPNTSFALIQGLRDQGVTFKAIVPAGYGNDLLEAGPGVRSDAQNAYFNLPYQPVEMKTAATKALQADFASAGVPVEPTFASYNGYLSVGLLVRGLTGAGTAPTSASLTTALSNVHDWDALGLFGGHTLDVNDRENIVGGADECGWLTQFKGDVFTLVSGGDPVCGSVIPGKTIAPSS